MSNLLTVVPLAIALLVAGVLCLVAWGYVRFARGRKKAERIWRENQPRPVADFGRTRSLSILPLVDWHTSRPELRAEAGVAYLIETDQNVILFDVGYNPERADPSPLLHNMQMMNLTTADFDTVVISHNHVDHVGGWKWTRGASFSLGNEQIDLSGKRVFTPVPMTYPGLQPIHAPEPTVVASAVATIGTISRQLALGWVDEQALAINVDGKGIVLVVGCGHQTLPKILQRAELVFSEPIYGVIGGLHYPVPTGRVTILGLNVQRLLASGAGLLHPLTKEDVAADIAVLQQRQPGIVGVSGHDSSDEVIEQFRRAFGSAYRDLRVGERIVIAG